MKSTNLFWLHIRKSAGMTTRSLLEPYYVEVANRVNKPKSFVQATPREYNDILNNYLVVLGEYQFKRCLFAKKYLYPENWNNMFSFAFSREPIDRCISMFFYLFRTGHGLSEVMASVPKKCIAQRLRLRYCLTYAFDVFLDSVHEALLSQSIFCPFGLHFTTHIAPMWSDITDLEGVVLLKQVYRLENLVEGINHAFEQCGIAKRLDANCIQLNRNYNRKEYIPTKIQKRKIEQIYNKDFEVYENAWR